MEKCNWYKCVLFDMDGTLVDSYEGIYHAYRWTMEQMGRDFDGDNFVRRAIGAPLIWVFQNLCGMEQSEAERAVAQYRSYYAKKGKYQVRVYDGIKGTLGKLKRSGCYLGAATLKKETFANEMLLELGLRSYFDVVCGMDEDDCLTKVDLIRRCMQAAKSSREETILVGDSEFDADGARKAGITFLAVTYGFGFQDQKKLKECGVSMVAETAAEIADLLCGAGKETGE